MFKNDLNVCPIKAAIFDMDGVLIDSEPLWQQAETKVFARVGLCVTPEMCLETMGMRVDQVVRYRYERQPWQGKSLRQVEEEILQEMERLIAERGRPAPGAQEVLDFFRRRGIRLALASSSYMRIIQAVLETLHLTEVFEVVHSAEFEEHGKPDPAIYLTTLRKLGLPARAAIAFEDSPNGVRAAKAAGLRVVCIPDKHVGQHPAFDSADLVLRSLTEFSESHLKLLGQAET